MPRNARVTIPVVDLEVGDIIVERIAGTKHGKESKTTVVRLEHRACGQRGTHVNGKACYDRIAQVLVERPGAEQVPTLEEEMAADWAEMLERAYAYTLQSTDEELAANWEAVADGAAAEFQELLVKGVNDAFRKIGINDPIEDTRKLFKEVVDAPVSEKYMTPRLHLEPADYPDYSIKSGPSSVSGR